MTQNDIIQLAAVELARRIAVGELNSVDAVEACIAQIEKVNPALNAVVVKRYDAARTEAREADAKRLRGEPLPPLHGVPITVKECLDLTGTPSTFGLQTRATHRAEADEIHVARLRAAGAIVLGKTNVSQCLVYTEADNPLYGRTNNPWNSARTCGGSSGGEGAIIAAGGSTLGLGTDIGGSVRVPAHFCGIASLKPTSGRCPDLGRYSFPIGQQAIPSVVGVLARHVEDVALGIQIISKEPRSTQISGPALGDWRAVDLGQLRVAYYTHDGSFEPAPAVIRAVTEAAACLGRAGAQVTAWTPPDVLQALELFNRILTADGLTGLRRTLKGSARSPQISMMMLGAGMPRGLLALLAGLLRASGQPLMARSLTAFAAPDTDTYWRLLEALHDYREQFARELDRAPGGPFDLILAPPCSLPAFTHGATRDLLTAGAYATLYNLLGYPAGIVPITRVRPDEETARPASRDLLVKLVQKIERGSAGLPVGVQVVARPWQEHIALAAMHALEHSARTQPDFPQTPADSRD